MTMAELTQPDFPILRRIVNGRPLVFLDSAASSQKPTVVLEAMTRYYEQSHANVHRSIHTLGEEATELYEGARDAVRAFIGAASREEVIFTRGTTEGVNLVAQAIGRTLRLGDEILVNVLGRNVTGVLREAPHPAYCSSGALSRSSRVVTYSLQ